MLARFRRWLTARRTPGEAKSPAPSPSLPDYDFVYTVSWVKTTREWPPERRLAAQEAVRTVLEAPDFEANEVERRYTVDGIEGTYSGASLRALARVLAEWQRRED